MHRKETEANKQTLTKTVRSQSHRNRDMHRLRDPKEETETSSKQTGRCRESGHKV